MTNAPAQSRFQVRFDWGLDGAAAVAAGAHVVVWADAIETPGAPSPLQLDAGPAILSASVGSRVAAAEWIIAKQAELGDRAMVAVIAAGTDDGRFAVEDFLAAGAVIDALGDVGIDFTSPEAAAAAAAFDGLRNATQHLLSASVTGQTLPPEAIVAAKAAAVDATLRVIRP